MKVPPAWDALIRGQPESASLAPATAGSRPPSAPSSRSAGSRLGRRVGVGAGAHDGHAAEMKYPSCAAPVSVALATQRKDWLPGTVLSASMPARSMTSWPGAKSVTRSRLAPAGLSATSLKSRVAAASAGHGVLAGLALELVAQRVALEACRAAGAERTLDADQRVGLAAALGRVVVPLRSTTTATRLKANSEVHARAAGRAVVAGADIEQVAAGPALTVSLPPRGLGGSLPARPASCSRRRCRSDVVVRSRAGRERLVGLDRADVPADSRPAAGGG